ncbi:MULTISPECIES: DUF934 domain-containing protein [unclassified Halomonas]|uniref:DUF934 domain-containing protein n=1 Tax=unclassified Halomonas TaxID=2609666 RepID=UPI001C971963|nr:MULTISPECIES: DUF934 domain-containing protein [unclassified Halomonas]MBY5925902.1 DUF934 domain-containing protein [Halomonas sp. DP4Y7-2]MBY6232944.1 DUF934 domain-containing protein [Halomonas sp. DP4Y7-1]
MQPEATLQDTPQRPLIKERRLAEDSWVRLEDEASADQPNSIVRLDIWLAAERRDDLAPWLPSDTVLDDDTVAELRKAPLIAIDFPKFTDGRGYTLARVLRERYGISGEIRAVGDVLIDQLSYMARCGFDAFSLREDQIVEDALNALTIFSRHYQVSIDNPEPMFLRRQREARERQRDTAVA